jgi:hypothetical protein
MGRPGRRAPRLGLRCGNAGPARQGIGWVAWAGQSGAQEVLEQMANLDLYFPGDGRTRRISIAQGVVDFSALGEAIQGGAGRNMDVCIAECERRFTNLVLDKRQVNVRPRGRLMVGAPAHENRRLLAFGTVELQDLLEEVSPELAGITQYELSSRITYVMLRGEDGVWSGQAAGGGGANAVEG